MMEEDRRRLEEAKEIYRILRKTHKIIPFTHLLCLRKSLYVNVGLSYAKPFKIDN